MAPVPETPTNSKTPNPRDAAVAKAVQRWIRRAEAKGVDPSKFLGSNYAASAETDYWAPTNQGGKRLIRDRIHQMAKEGSAYKPMTYETGGNLNKDTQDILNNMKSSAAFEALPTTHLSQSTFAQYRPLYEKLTDSYVAGGVNSNLDDYVNAFRGIHEARIYGNARNTEVHGELPANLSFGMVPEDLNSLIDRLINAGGA